ncbi:recombinase family protein [Streptomyces naphthomycinicus]|uniref:recombinase family protein n=1 Tax=Streptomyces naphthomycinicus TaxID=2872625 RepID=UPI001CEDE819|nr:recombinase family protein [Streptomyces sp. TML10]
MPYAPEYLHLVFTNTEFEALLYGRASRDPRKQGYSVADQMTDGRSLCNRFNWHIGEEFKDLGLSASRHATKMRDDFEELLEAIEQGPSRPGVTRIVVAFEASRYYRDLEAYVRLRNACYNAGALLCYNGTVYDLSRREDRKATAQDAIAAEDEAEGIAERNQRTARLTAEAGGPHGRLQYGFLRDYEVVSGKLRCVRQYEDPVRGKYVFQSFERVDSGGSVRSVLRWLRATPEAARPDGSEWTDIMVRRMLTNRAYIGERVHHGTVRPATWAAIKGLDTPAGRAMFNRVLAKLTDPDRRMQRGSEVSHLLTLIGLCGQCGDHALLEPTKMHGRGYLRCEAKNDVSIREDWIDGFVEEAVISWFTDKKKARAALVPDSTDVEEKLAAAELLVGRYEEQLREARALAQEFDEATGRFKLSPMSLASMEQTLLPRLEKARAQQRSITGVSPLLLSMLQDPENTWNGVVDDDGQVVRPALTVEQKREVIKLVVTVRLYKAEKPGAHRLDPRRIRLSFVGEEGFRERPLRVPEAGSAR